jgi:glycosyltransferase involved in cell wall biosynthesis
MLNSVRSPLTPLDHFPQGGESSKKVAILLATYHGQRFLQEQLASFAAQTHTNWEVWASDDGSEDDTHRIMEEHLQLWGDQRLSIHNGPREGFAANFLSLTCNAQICADYFAYSDQDDVWERDKLERAVRWLDSVPDNIPGLYCSRTRLVDEKNCEIGVSPLFTKAPSFSNALMQNIGGGNTMVLNKAARELLQVAGDQVVVATHDWWAYVVVTGCGGRVFYDRAPTVRYRQHEGNLVGMNSSWKARLKRIRMMFAGQFRGWNDMHLHALPRLDRNLTPDCKVTLERFARARKRSLVPRLWGLAHSGVYRQTILGNLGLLVAAIFNKI